MERAMQGSVRTAELSQSALIKRLERARKIFLLVRCFDDEVLSSNALAMRLIDTTTFQAFSALLGSFVVNRMHRQYGVLGFTVDIAVLQIRLLNRTFPSDSVSLEHLQVQRNQRLASTDRSVGPNIGLPWFVLVDCKELERPSSQEAAQVNPVRCSRS